MDSATRIVCEIRIYAISIIERKVKFKAGAGGKKNNKPFSPFSLGLFDVQMLVLYLNLWWYKYWKGLSHEIFGPVYWAVWMHLGLNENHFRFFNFKDALSIWDSHFKFWCVSVQTFSEILRICEKDWQLSPRFSKIYLNCQLFSDTLMLLKNILREPWTVAHPSPRTGDSVANPSQRFYESPRNIFTLSSVSRRTASQKFTKIGEPQAKLPILFRDS